MRGALRSLAVPPSSPPVSRVECHLCGSLETLHSLGLHLRWNHGNAGTSDRCKDCDTVLGPDIMVCPLCDWRAQKKWLEEHPRGPGVDLAMLPTWASFGVWA